MPKDNDLKIKAYTANCGNGTLGREATRKIVEAFLPQHPDIFQQKLDISIINVQETHFSKAEKELRRSIAEMQIPNLFMQMKERTKIGFDKPEIFYSIFQAMFDQAYRIAGEESYLFDRRVNAAVQGAITDIRIALNQQALAAKMVQELSQMLAAAIKSAPQVIMAPASMLTLTKLDPRKSGFMSSGIGQLIIFNPQTVSAPVFEPCDASPSVRRRTNVEGSIFSSAVNKGGVNQRIRFTKAGGASFVVNAVSGHLESNQVSKRNVDISNVMARPAARTFAELASNATDVVVFGFDSNTRAPLRKPQLAFQDNKLVITEADETGKGIPWQSDVMAPETRGLSMSLHGNLYTAPNTYHEHPATKFSEKRLRFEHGSLDIVGISSQCQKTAVHMVGDESDNISIEKRSKRDHNIIATPTQSIAVARYSSKQEAEFHRVRKDIARSLSTAAPRLADYILQQVTENTKENRQYLLTIHNTFVAQGGLLQQRTALDAFKQEFIEKRRRTCYQAFKTRAQEQQPIYSEMMQRNVHEAVIEDFIKKQYPEGDNDQNFKAITLRFLKLSDQKAQQELNEYKRLWQLSATQPNLENLKLADNLHLTYVTLKNLRFHYQQQREFYASHFQPMISKALLKGINADFQSAWSDINDLEKAAFFELDVLGGAWFDGVIRVGDNIEDVSRRHKALMRLEKMQIKIFDSIKTPDEQKAITQLVKKAHQELRGGDTSQLETILTQAKHLLLDLRGFQQYLRSCDAQLLKAKGPQQQTKRELISDRRAEVKSLIAAINPQQESATISQRFEAVHHKCKDYLQRSALMQSYGVSSLTSLYSDTQESYLLKEVIDRHLPAPQDEFYHSAMYPLAYAYML